MGNTSCNSTTVGQFQVSSAVRKMVVQMFYNSTSGSQETKKAQKKIEDVLSSKSIPFERRDISQDGDLKDFMRESAGPDALPPQIFNNFDYCGDFDAFEAALE